MKKTLWLSYAWADNVQHDVDYVAQQIRSSEIGVKQDRFVLAAGQRLWEQIAHHITNPQESDAWAIYATQESLRSEACREEFAYALDRALSSRGQNFPLIGIFPGSFEQRLIPAGIRSRLYVSLEDKDWVERVRAAVRGDAPSVTGPMLEPFALQVHQTNGSFQIEVRPRAGQWAPVVVAVPAAESEISARFYALFGAKGFPPPGGLVMGVTEGELEGWNFKLMHEVATPTRSCFITVPELPSQLLFGQDGGPNWILTRDQLLSSILPVTSP